MFAVNNKTMHPRLLLQIMNSASMLSMPVRFSAFPAYFLMQIVKFYSNAMQSKYRLVPLPKRFYDVLTGKLYLKCEHYLFVAESTYDEYIKTKDVNWLNIQFLNDSTDNKLVLNQPEVVTAILKKPTLSTLVPVLLAPAGVQLESNCIYVNENCYQNFIVKYKQPENEAIFVKLQEIQAAQTVPQLANKATIFIINQPHEIPNDLIDAILGSFFDSPRILYRNYSYEIVLNESVLGNSLYAKNFHIFSNLKKLYFRCVHLESKDSPFELNAVVVKTLTSLQQTTSINMTVPKQQLHELCCGVSPCPTGLQKYFTMLKSSILPFIPSEAGIASISLTTFPLFLLQGHRGSGKTTILHAVAQDLGLQVFSVDCVEIVSQIPSQTEAKIKIVLNKANLCEPLIIALFNFEVNVLFAFLYNYTTPIINVRTT